MAQLKVVKQSLLRYEPGEVGHIENVLQGQLRERLHSVKQRTEESYTVETERSTSSEKDLQSTDRFEVTEETNSTISEQRQHEAGVTVTASYGPVSVSANTDYSSTSARQMGEKLSRSFAREVIDRSIEKVQQRVREERVRKTTLEIEETNRHTLSAPAKSVVGIYRWVDKIYWAQVNVYGKRMMLEFMVPEPAAVYLYGSTVKPPEPTAVEPPPPLDFTAHELDRVNYASLGSKYGAEVEAPPPPFRMALHGARTNSDNEKQKLTLPEGWVGLRAATTYSYTYQQNPFMTTMFGGCYWNTNEFGWRSMTDQSSGDIPIIVHTLNVLNYAVSIDMVAEPSEALFEKWQLDTYKAIAQA